MFELFEKGGPVMWPLLACSLASGTVVLERAWFLWRLRTDTDTTMCEQTLKCVENGDWDEADRLINMENNPAMRMLGAALHHRQSGPSEAMEMVATEMLHEARRRLGILDTIITLAPLLGILGTVMGIIQSFDLLGASGIENPHDVVGGIAKALITTATGLSIAIITLVPYNYFHSRVGRFGRMLEQIGTRMELALRHGQEAENEADR